MKEKAVERKMDKDIADRIFSATTHLETARTVLQVTADCFGLYSTDQPEEDRRMIGCQVEAIGIMLNVVDDYILRASSALDESGGTA